MVKGTDYLEQWCMPVIPATLEVEDCTFKASLGNSGGFCLKIKNKKDWDGAL